jgi:hypothetical protein
MTPGRKVGVLIAVAMVALVTVLVTNALSATAQGVRVEVVPAHRYCTSATGQPVPCQRSHQLRGPKNHWLVIFSFVAPTSTARGGKYYFFTARGPVGCGNEIQGGTAAVGAVRKGQRVISSATFAKNCPGPGHGTIGLRQPHSRPLMAVGRLGARFNFTIP